MLEDPFGYITEEKQHRCYWRRVGFFLFLLILALVLSMLVLPRRANAGAKYKAEAGSVSIVLYDDQCTHIDHVTNLPYRATWTEDGKVIDGCFGFDPGLKLLRFWFADRSVIAIPAAVFSRVVET